MPRTRILRGGHLAKVSVGKSGVDSVEFRMVEGVVGLESKLDSGPSAVVIRNSLNRLRFQLKRPGPTMESLPAVP